MHKRRILNKVDIVFVGIGMVLAFLLIMVKLVGYVLNPSNPISIEIVTSYLQQLCAAIPFDIIVCR
jgi:Na+-transporting methylmalonyl-CoA/oxaloacetate decarboxylase gamma subunit